MKVNYKTSVYVAAGWRNVIITAEITQLTEKMGVVRDVLLIDDQEPVGYMSRGGGNSHRQRFHAGGIAQREIGKRKRLASCWGA
jgi:hypothetical protein